jgi:SAM-dependent methyltransferase
MVKRKSYMRWPGTIRSLVGLTSGLREDSGSPFEAKCFIENGFPVKRLHKVAMAQGNAKMPIYQIHKWWARRLSSVFRALIISSSIDANAKDFWSKYYDGFALDGKVIYDPMMGGGTTMFEGLRLGCRVIGSDINPVAWFVTKKEIDPFDEAEADKQFAILNEKVGGKIRKLYTTRCPRGHVAEVLYCLWIRKQKCKACGKVHKLFNNLIVRQTYTHRTFVCPDCGEIFTRGLNVKKPRCSRGHKVDVDSAPVADGWFDCPSCNSKERIIDAVKRTGRPLDSEMFCIEYACEHCRKRGYKKPSISDIRLFEKARRQFARMKSELEFPTQRIGLISDDDKRPNSHGFKRFDQLFSERQLLALATLLHEIKEIKDKNMREYFLLILSSSLETNNTLCKYETNWGKISALFGFPSYHVPERFAENNLWGSGRGTFPRNFAKLKRGKRYADAPFERIYRSKSGGRWDPMRKPVGTSVTTKVSCEGRFDFDSQDWRARIECRDSANYASIPDKRVDAVITDPPYFETIKYSKLADFFYVWLRLGLKDDYRWFKAKTSQRGMEAVAYGSSTRDVERFVRRFTKILKEAGRVLKDDGVLIFTFHHTKPWAWEGLRRALHSAGFYVTATPIIRSEGKTGYRRGDFIGYDACIVCRKNDGVRLPKMADANMVQSYTQDVRNLKKLDKTITEPEILTVIMSNYLKADDDSAKTIMERAPTLIGEIRQRLRFRSG